MVAIPSVQQSTQEPTIVGVARRLARACAIVTSRPLILILAMQTMVSVTTLHNTAFQDEALYIYAGRQIVGHWLGGPAPLENYAFYFSGYPYVYPVIGGVLDRIGGLELARWFSLLCMLGVNAILYSNTRKLFGPLAAVFASAGYASAGVVLFVSRLATFDALCLLLIALATGAACQVSVGRRPWLALVLGPLFVLSILAKYAAMIFVLPVLSILAFYSLCVQGWWRTLLRLALVIVALAISLGIAYHFMDKSAFHAIAGSTTNRTAEILVSRQQLLIRVLQMGGIVYAVALLGLGVVFIRFQRFRLVALVLYASSWLMPAYHIYKQEGVSVDKHIAFGLFFAMPLAGCALAWLSGEMQHAFANSNGRSWLVGFSVVLIIFTVGLKQSQTIYASWANTSNLRYALRTQMRTGGGRYLIEDIEVTRYDMEDIAQPWQWNGLAYLYYVTADHRQLLGDPALAQAIKDRYFALVELSFIYQPADAFFAAQQMATTRNYDLIARVQFQNSFGIDYFYIWRVAAQPGHGNFTSLSQVKP